MNKAEAIEEALRAFPKLYYFVPPLPPFEVSVPEKNRSYLAKNKSIAEVKTIKIQTPLDAILWFIDVLCPEHDNEHCLHADVQHLVSRWTKVSFSREIAKLQAAELITVRDQPSFRKAHELQLTPKGKRYLKKIKDHRRSVLALLFQGLDSTEMERITAGLNNVANGTWPKMKHRSPKTKKSKHVGKKR